MTLKALIVDDEALARSRLRRLLADCRDPQVLLAGEAANAPEAVALLGREKFDVALLDIHIPGADGLGLARTIQQMPDAPWVIFVTAHAGHALQAFEVEAVDYLTKPVRLERLQAALQKVQRQASQREVSGNQNGDDALLIQERGRTERVPLSDVLYFKAELKYVTVRTARHSHIFDGALGDLEARYGARFMRIHRNALVARHALRALERHVDHEEGEVWAVRLVGIDEALAVSRRQLPAVREALGACA